MGLPPRIIKLLWELLKDGEAKLGQKQREKFVQKKHVAIEI